LNRILAIVFLVITCVAVRGQKTAPFADSIRKAYNIPEMSYAVVDAGTILEMAASGKHSIDLPDSASLNDRFHIGSNTKAMTAFMIARYVERGKLHWSTKFFDLFPDWKAGSNKAFASITLQDLLSHRAGIQPFQGEGDPTIPDFKGTAMEKRWQFGKFVLTLEAVSIDSATPFLYSNAGYTLASMMLEKVARKSWEELVEQLFNQDLHMNVKLSWPENQKRKDTWGHRFENGRLIPVASNKGEHLDYTEPDGDINIRLKDYIRFIQLNLQGLAGKNNYLKAATYNFIHRGVDHYSMGWYNIYENNKELSTHSGTAFTYYTLVHIDRTQNKAYIIFTNAFSDDTRMGVRLLMRKLKENYGG